jgi:hypothetical protein
MWVALGIAAALHMGLLLYAYLTPERTPQARKRIIEMEVVRRTPPPPPPKKEEEPPKKEEEPPKKEEPQPPPRGARPLPSLLQPVPRDKSSEDPASPAIVVPAQPQQPEVKPPPGGGPINLFDRDSLSKAAGVPGSGAAVPKGPNRLLKDERLEEKKEPDFPLVPDKGGGYRFDGQHFTARIGPDGALSFEDKGPIGFAKGQSGFSFDLTDLMMKGGKQDPYRAEKRRFVEHTEKLREDLRRKRNEATLDSALASLPRDLAAIWESRRAPGVRRREIYEYWVDCADDKDGNDTQGQRARRQVEEYVRRHLPAGSPDGYTEEELLRFAASREGLPLFDPYRNLRR